MTAGEERGQQRRIRGDPAVRLSRPQRVEGIEEVAAFIQDGNRAASAGVDPHDGLGVIGRGSFRVARVSARWRRKPLRGTLAGRQCGRSVQPDPKGGRSDAFGRPGGYRGSAKHSLRSPFEGRSNPRSNGVRRGSRFALLGCQSEPRVPAGGRPDDLDGDALSLEQALHRGLE